MIAIENLGFTYPRAKTAALKDFSLAVPEGSVAVVAGESGSGKTTLLRLIAGFLLPDSGTIAIGERRVSDTKSIVAPEDRAVGVVFQDFALFPHLTVEQNVEFGIRRLGRRARGARVAECLDLLGIGDLAQRYPHELSGGQAQRTALARTLAPSPRVIVMDEPFNNLNVALRHELVPLVGHVLRSTGTTAVVVTHDPHEAFELADQMALLKDGRLEQIGTARELYEEPATRYVAHFFGPVNELDPAGVLARSLTAAVAGQRGAGDDPVPLPKTQEGSLVLRPEQIALVDEGAGQVDASVEAVRFAGEHLVVELAGQWSGLLRAHVEKGDVAIGSRVGVSIGSAATSRHAESVSSA